MYERVWHAYGLANKIPIHYVAVQGQNSQSAISFLQEPCSNLVDTLLDLDGNRLSATHSDGHEVMHISKSVSLLPTNLIAS